MLALAESREPKVTVMEKPEASITHEELKLVEESKTVGKLIESPGFHTF